MKKKKTFSEIFWNILVDLIFILIGAGLIASSCAATLVVYNAVADGTLPSWVLLFIR